MCLWNPCFHRLIPRACLVPLPNQGFITVHQAPNKRWARRVINRPFRPLMSVQCTASRDFSVQPILVFSQCPPSCFHALVPFMCWLIARTLGKRQRRTSYRRMARCIGLSRSKRRIIRWQRCSRSATQTGVALLGFSQRHTLATAVG